jgi:hypothetical protein
VVVTLIEERPEAAAHAEAELEESSPPDEATRRERSQLVRRLPYALAVVLLAAGYAIGTAAHTPKSAPTSVNALVTPEQINQALSTTNGQPTTGDRGFSLLENGVQHSHGFDLPMSQADRAELGREMDLARQTALKYPTLADAEAAGLVRAGPFSPGLGTHMIAYGNYGYGAGTDRMTDEQIEHPLAWIYDGTHPDSPVAGLFYNATVANPEGFIGPNDVWHSHSNICMVQRPGGGIDTPLGADHDATQAQCAAVGGTLLPTTGSLLHAWVVPGYEDSQGVFAHLSPAITCDDGTYQVVATQDIGTRTSICVDGTE